jgi:RNA polymerase sigma factor (sigma-70 family)
MEAATLTPLARGRRALTSDERLVAATRLGDDRAFETLYHRYHRRIHAYVVGMVKDQGRAEDVTQEVFLSAHRRIRATDRDIAFKPWIYEIAKNACIDQFRRSRRTDEVSYDADGQDGGVAPLVSGGPGPVEAVESRTQLHDLCGAFGGLSDSHHQILVLRELEGRSYQEIGERMQMTRPAVESTLFRARKRLSEEYAELVSGERCRKVQAIIAASEEARLGARDRRTMARHVSHCQPCRRAAALAGLELAPARAKIAALVPLPAFVRERWLGGGPSPSGGVGGGGGGALAAWAQTVAPVADGASGWTKAVAASVALAIAGAGAGAVATHGGGRPEHRPAPRTTASAAVPVPVAGTAIAARPAARISHASGAARSASAAVGASAPAHRASGGAGDAGREAPADAAAPPTSGGGVPPASSGSGGGHSSGGDASPASASGGPPASTDRAPAKQTVPSVAPVGDTGATVPSSPDVPQTVEHTTQAVQGVVDGTTQTVQGVVSATTQAAQGAVDATTLSVQGVVDATVPAASGVVAATAQTVHGVVAGATQTVQGVVNGTTDGIQGIVHGLGKPSSSGG